MKQTAHNSYLDQPLNQIQSVKDKESYAQTSVNETANFNACNSYFNTTLSGMSSTIKSNKQVSLSNSVMGHRSSSQLKMATVKHFQSNNNKMLDFTQS